MQQSKIFKKYCRKRIKPSNWNELLKICISIIDNNIYGLNIIAHNAYKTDKIKNQRLIRSTKNIITL